MSHCQHQTIHQKDYKVPDYLIDTVELAFDLDPEDTRVVSRLAVRSNHDRGEGVRPLVLDGEELTLLSLKLDGAELEEGAYRVDENSLVLAAPPGEFLLEIETRVHPKKNSALSGLYASGPMLCTQCEAEGFRRITYFTDRPDVMAVYTVTLRGDKAACPVLLANGNLVEKGDLPDGRHFAVWHDPFKKPSYLFAVVAGDLVHIADRFTTMSGREVRLEIYVEERNRDKCEHALRSLMSAMRWDEEQFGREYDLDTYMVVAVDDFNMGAMENKGLNVFNSRYVLASPESATDDDYQAIEEVIGHEYFHNWTGNRITCRDWFQLSLKEGLTIFRDQEFSADMQSRPVKRIADVRSLRSAQFSEDAGPLAHPVRPESYVEINNFYSMTVYHKGGEVIRMLQTLLGREAFRAGMDLYFERHDGQAVRVDEFVQAMADAGKRDLSQFMLWYDQAGTPVLTVSDDYRPDGSYTLTVTQSCPPTPGQPEKKPFHIPLAMGLLDREGNELPLKLSWESEPAGKTRVLELRRETETFTFVGLKDRPVPSLLRNFSAPVKLVCPYSDDDLTLLMTNDSDPFVRWEAGQIQAVKLIMELIADIRGGREAQVPERFIESFRRLLSDDRQDRAFLAETLALPTESYLAEQMAVIDPDAIHQARELVRAAVGQRLGAELAAVRKACAPKAPYRPDDGLAGCRRLKNLSLSYLMAAGGQEAIDACIAQFKSADNMTDSLGALSPLANCACPEREEAFASFYQCWRGDRGVIDKWFSLQASSRLPDTMDRVLALLEHPDFDVRNPNRVRSLVGAFSQGNQVRFHDVSGRGYRFLGDQILRLNGINPQIAARMLTPFSRWRRFDPARQQLMKKELERILAEPGLARDVYELAAKSL
ncbi:aminopeptidase N [Geomonas subterranea]|uniref:Aminopeptidase N n=1 Tax=Geomonas subterranea TaxID=2847989 RepID=A0ABX8LCK2_9BACT|nr:aminopeptidase N [Geomonas subterranea]QXE89752.1 aminopeptidase N [Geomonas subterranea]QXM08129.1 aminopeptidase N [Geomonas subterranea]